MIDTATTYTSEEIDVLETLSTINALTGQYELLAQKILTLKRRIAGRRVVGISSDASMDERSDARDARDARDATRGCESNERSNDAKDATVSTEKKRGRGRPKKNMILTSNMHPQRDAINNLENSHRLDDAVYVLENNNLFIRNTNGVLFDVETRSVMGWYNPYAQSGTIDWLYK